MSVPHKSTPLINSSNMINYRNETVQIVGKIVKFDRGTLLLQSSDLGNIDVNLGPDSEASGMGPFVTIIGRVDSEGEKISEFKTLNLGENLDFQLVENCIHLQQQFPQIFTRQDE